MKAGCQLIHGKGRKKQTIEDDDNTSSTELPGMEVIWTPAVAQNALTSIPISEWKTQKVV